MIFRKEGRIFMSFLLYLESDEVLSDQKKKAEGIIVCMTCVFMFFPNFC